jgi:hypothetical protein
VLTFKHQRVFDPFSQEAVHLTEPPSGNDIPEDLNFVGPAIAAHVAQAIATGQICPVTYEPFEVRLARGRSRLRVSLKDVFHCELSVLVLLRIFAWSTSSYHVTFPLLTFGDSGN